MKDNKRSLKKNSHNNKSQDILKNLKQHLSNKKSKSDNSSKILSKLKIDNTIFSQINPRMALVIVCIIILFIVFILTVNINSESQLESQQEKAVCVMLGNNSLGNVIKIGPYGNTSSNVTIAYILGVHPREKGAHKLMNDSFMQLKDNNLSYCYYIYQVNVTQNPTDFDLSRMNGQILAQDFAVQDIINNSFNLAVDCHYSDGSWNVKRFIFTPDEDNQMSRQVAYDINSTFDWITYYMPDNPSSPSFVTGPLNAGGIPAIVYEAYAYDSNNTTISHDMDLINYLDNYNFTIQNEQL